MNTTDRQRAFLERTKKALDQSADRLDEATSHALASARAQALTLAARKQSLRARLMPNPLRAWMVPAGALTSVALTVIALALLVREPQLTTPLASEDLELLSSSESLDLYEELEFYRWLAERGRMG